LPDISTEIKVQNKSFLIQTGIIGKFVKNTFRNLSAINPYLATMTSQENTRETEFYGGIKAALGDHFNFSAKAAYINYRNLPLMVNDTLLENSFVISNETKASNFRIRSDISYIKQDKFTVTAGLTLNGFTGLQVNTHAWHTVPIEITGALRWWAFEKLLLKSDVYFYNGGKYRLKTGEARALPGASDVSAGAEYKINKQFSAWISANNLFNDRYQRWHNYEVYGINATAGILINF
jgi:outer membrane receptor for ferric coprogen and ferric-rhodotorulic acid